MKTADYIDMLNDAIENLIENNEEHIKKRVQKLIEYSIYYYNRHEKTCMSGYITAKNIFDEINNFWNTENE